MAIVSIGTTVALTTHTITSTNAAAFAVGRQGATNPAFQVNANAATSVTGLQISSAASGAGVALAAISSSAAEALTIDALGTGTITLNGTGTGAVRSGTNFLSIGALAGSGYATGAGGTVTQITSSSTGVTLSKPCGTIVTVALTTAAAAIEQFTVTNTLVAATDVIAVSTTYNGAGTPQVSVIHVTAGTFDIIIKNAHAANALNAAMTINFAIIKAVTS